MIIFFSGLPGTLKFIVEFFIFCGLMEISFTMCALILGIANIFGLIGFCKSWFNVLFGINLKLRKKNILDLTKKELFILLFIFFCLFFFTFFPYFIF
jgi:NADH:ubiquinone oxidoreductase subunit 4 (subunit M)